MAKPSGRVTEPNVRLADASAIVEAMNEASSIFLPKPEKIAWLMQKLSPLIGENLDFHILLFDQLDRVPVPRCIDRVTYGPTFAVIEPRPESQVQRLMDQCGPICEQSIPEALNRFRTPNTYIYSTDSDPDWYRDTFRPQLLEPNKWEDCMACYWAGSKDHLIIYNVFRWRGSPPFTETHRNTLSLMTRAVAPLMDGDLFLDLPEEANQLDSNLKAVLVPVLQGFTDKEISAMAGVMSDVVDIAVRKLLDHFAAKSRGELMARFVDQRVLRWLAESSGLTSN